MITSPSSEIATKVRAANDTLIVAGNLEATEEFFAPDYRVHFTVRDITGGCDLVRQALGTLRRAFPEIQVELEVLVEHGDRIAWQRTLQGVQQGAYQGFPPTGRRIVWRDMVTSRFDKGLITEEWVVTDLAEQLLHARKR